MKPQYSEDYNSGLCWSFMIERDDISKNQNIPKIENQCPFPPEVKRYVESMITDTVGIIVDEFRIRKFSKLKENVNQLYRNLVADSKVPQIKEIEIAGAADGLQVIVFLGKGYMVDFLWTVYNEHASTVAEWYNRSGKEWIREWLDKKLKTSTDKWG